MSETYGNEIVVDIEQGREFLKNLKKNEQTYMRSLLSLSWES